MVKHWNRRVGNPLQSFHIEVIAMKVMTSWGDIAWDVFKWFDAAQAVVSSPLYYEGGLVDGYLGWDGRQKALGLLGDATAQARAAWSCTYNGREDHRGAITAWRKVFGMTFPTYG